MLDTPPQNQFHKYLHIFNASEHSCIMMIMVDGIMSITECDLN